MKFSEILAPNSLQIDAYDASHFRINGRVFAHAVLLLPDTEVQPWTLITPGTLNCGDLDLMLDTQPQVIVIGTGARALIPAPTLMAAGADRGIGIEWMQTGAACRTYNLLASEGRRVAAGLLLEQA